MVLLQVDHSWGEEIAPALIPAGIDVDIILLDAFVPLYFKLKVWTDIKCRLTSEEVVRLNSGLEHILDIMGETISEHVIKTTIVR